MRSGSPGPIGVGGLGGAASEWAVGEPVAIAAIVARLTAERQNKPTFELESSTLEDLRSRPATFRLAIDLDVLDALLDRAQANVRSRWLNFELFPPERYFVLAPPGSEVGSFYSPRSIGFRYLPFYAATATLGGWATPQERAVDLARAYLHDSIHAATRRVFRYSEAAARGGVYRSSYGFNFRTPSGLSYSPVQIELPLRLNLGVLMDGVTVLVTGLALKGSLGAAVEGVRQSLVDDVLATAGTDHQPSAADPLATDGRRFRGQVVGPARSFLEYWSCGDDDLLTLLLRSMRDGRLRNLEAHFAAATGAAAAWRLIFMSEGWRLVKSGQNSSVHASVRQAFAFEAPTAAHREPPPPVRSSDAVGAARAAHTRC